MALTLGPSLHEGHDGQLTSAPSRAPRDPSYPDTALCDPTIREGKVETRMKSALKKAIGGSNLGPEPTAPVHIQGTSSLVCPSLPAPPTRVPFPLSRGDLGSLSKALLFLCVWFLC